MSSLQSSNVHLSSGRQPFSAASSRPKRGLVSLLHVLLASLFHISTSYAAPLLTVFEDDNEGKPASDPSLWLYLTIAMVLVLLGGAFAGLTIA